MDDSQRVRQGGLDGRRPARALAVALLASGLAFLAPAAWAQSSGGGLFGGIQQLFGVQKQVEQDGAGQGEYSGSGVARGFASDPSGSAQPYSTSGPVALVESIENAPKAGVELLDYVYMGQAIDLGPSGVMVLSYLESCGRETITGGRVQVGPGQSTVSGGAMARETVVCQGAKPIITADATEAGAAVKRVTPFDGQDWGEYTIRYRRPVFKWEPERRGEPVTVTLIYLDAKPPRIVWQGETSSTYLLYPKEAPKIEIGMPYLVQIANAAGRSVSAVFSVDPWLDVADQSAANWVIPIGR
ncbi:MAG: hypothetical protein V3S87_09620 [Alphaproteobacteria bacterium]